DLFAKARKYQMPAIAMTDHGNMFGAVDFYQKAYKAGIKPIIGCELYVAPGSRSDRGEGPRHLVVLAKDTHGYKNLMKLTSAGYLDGFYYKPRVDKELLALHSEGLICTSACLNGEISHLLLKGDKDGAQRVAEEYRDIFGEGNFYLEIMENGLEEQKRANEGLIELGKRLSIPMVATNDCHYLNSEDAEAHEVLLCIQTGTTMEDDRRMRFRSEEFYLKSPDEMKKSFDYCPEAIANTLEIANKCNLTLDLGHQFFLPNYEIEAGLSQEEHLANLAREGLERLMPAIAAGAESEDPEEISKKYHKRLEMELEIINSMEFPGYFLIVADFINYAKKKNIPVGPGRGSAAGSLVAYALGITNIDPIRYGLFFERFLNPSRRSMPDIDTDFCMEGRDEVIQYVTEKYGSDQVSQIITFGKMQAKAVVRDVGRALNMPYGEVDNIAKMIPNTLGITLKQAIKDEPRLAEEQRKNEKIRRLLSLSQSLEGLNRHASTHAAGVVISDVPLVERVPLYKSPNNDDIVTQYSMNDLQEVGLTKFDFLGLRTLTVIRDTIKFIREGRGEENFSIESIPLDDEATYDLLAKGQTDGVFQLESSGMKDIIVKMRPDCIEDIIALISLYRPGPMRYVPDFIANKQGKQKIVYEDPRLEEILKETYGITIYQEQVMQIAGVIGGYSMADADNLRRAMSKKKVSAMEKERPKFIAGAKKNKVSEAKAKKIWEQMETFSGYGFNKSHSAAYTMISFQTAYLKAHYPVEFMTALLTSEKNNRDNIIKYIASCRDMGINVLPPDINESFTDFSVVGENVRFGLSAVKNVGAGAVDSIITSRTSGGKFISFHDFCDRIDLHRANKKVIESLIKCGAFDSLEQNRCRLMEGYEDIALAAQRRNRDRMNGQTSLFDGPEITDTIQPDLPDVPEWDHDILLSYEKEMLGFYITGHPLLKYADSLNTIVDIDSQTLSAKQDGSTVSVAGVVSNIREVTTKRKDTMAYVTLEDLKGFITVIVFADLYRDNISLIHSEEPLYIKGRLDVGDEGGKVVASEITTVEEAIKTPFSSVHFMVDAEKSNGDTVENLKVILEKRGGKYPAYIHLLSSNEAETILSLGEGLGVELSEEIKSEADELLGPGATRFM
ncbi:MAG: DNA polymerase III subunit alpha, partial [Syntrophales bacterium]|nr:DNA polymerase III subunit alpha [Syntrophales bacterium]